MLSCCHVFFVSCCHVVISCHSIMSSCQFMLSCVVIYIMLSYTMLVKGCHAGSCCPLSSRCHAAMLAHCSLAAVIVCHARHKPGSLVMLVMLSCLPEIIMLSGMFVMSSCCSRWLHASPCYSISHHSYHVVTLYRAIIARDVVHTFIVVMLSYIMRCHSWS
jgi:hypothetical protein